MPKLYAPNLSVPWLDGPPVPPGPTGLAQLVAYKCTVQLPLAPGANHHRELRYDYPAEPLVALDRKRRPNVVVQGQARAWFGVFRPPTTLPIAGGGALPFGDPVVTVAHLDEIEVETTWSASYFVTAAMLLPPLNAWVRTLRRWPLSPTFDAL